MNFDFTKITGLFKMVCSTKVYFYVPNLIGFARVVLSLLCFKWAFTDFKICATMYFISFLLDGIDGHVARLLNQTSQFGAVLDMITDRFSTTCLCVVLAMLYPSYLIVFNCIIALDVSSHYFHMNCSLLLGSKSHKEVAQSKNFLLKLYYESRLFMSILCLGNELFFVLLYVTSFVPHPILSWVTRVVSVLMGLKQFMNVVQMVSACQTLVKYDVGLLETSKSE
ncbi:hypothetical protein GEMRC1_014173 [Eukaryota sp. GEM-RC1]